MAESKKSEAQSPERTDAGIYAGVEKYTKEDDPKDNIAYDPATGADTGAGVPPTTAELSKRYNTDGEATTGRHDGAPAAVKESAKGGMGPDEVTRRAVHPAPAPSREHLIENYPHIFPKLEEQAAEEAKKKEEAEKKAAESTSSSSSSDSGSDNDTTVKDHEKAHKKHKKDKKHHKHDKESNTDSDGHHHRGPVKVIAHVLHLDRHDRKLEKEQKEQEEKEMRHRQKSIKKRNDALENGVNALTQTDETFRIEEEGHGVPRKESAAAADGGAVSDARATHESIPLEILNPEGMERKQKEDELLKNGGDLSELAVKGDEEVKVPRDRIENLVERDHARIKAGLPAPPVEKDLKVAFHTNDSFDSLDKTAVPLK